MADEQKKGINPMLLLTLLSPLLGGLFGGNRRQTTEDVVTSTPPRGFQDPAIGLMSPSIWEMLLRNLQGLGGAGMPGGKSFVSPNIQSIIDHLGGQSTDLLSRYQDPKQHARNRRIEARNTSASRRG